MSGMLKDKYNVGSLSDTFVLANPEKGFYHGYETLFSNYQAMSLSTLQPWRTSENVTLVHNNYVLDNFVTSNITLTIMSKLTADFKTLRKGGMKSIVRFSYTLTDGNMNDAALTQLLHHIEQLKPFFQVTSNISLNSNFLQNRHTYIYTSVQNFWHNYKSE